MRIPLIKICDQSPSNWVCNGIPQDTEEASKGSSGGINIGDLIVEEPSRCITIITSSGLELNTQSDKAICIQSSDNTNTPPSTCVGINTNDSFRIITQSNEPICIN